MSHPQLRFRLLAALKLALLAAVCVADDAQQLVGPATEKRFPPLEVGDGFHATLFACDPLVEYPSVIAVGPRPGTLFVAHDYMTGLGKEIIRRDEIRVLEDSDGDGYADRSTKYAEGFNSVQGLAYYDGTVFVMHAPLLTSLRDTDGDGASDQRHDLIQGLGLPPEKNGTRLHCANGVVAGHDDWLYLALGDHGCDVTRPEGDRLFFREGGILRCRRDGRGLHVFASGLRNIYDIALDEELNVFVRDNENDGGDYMIRVCHSFFGADHGYPYLYYERPDEALTPLADLGRGSSAGGAAYLETAFPKEYRESLFFCEWGRAVVRYRLQRSGSGFAPTKEIDFAAGAGDDPYGFKPTDIVVDRDGSLLISDWADGQRPKRGRGRIYRITYTAKQNASDGAIVDTRESEIARWLAQLDSPSYSKRVEAQVELQRREGDELKALKLAIDAKTLGERARLHAVWILASVGESEIDSLFQFLENDSDPRVRLQALRAIADLTDPVLTEDCLDAGAGSRAIIARLLRRSGDTDSRVVRELIVALGRLRWRDIAAWLSHDRQEIFLRDLSRNVDPALAHAVLQAPRRAENWPAVLELLDGPTRSSVDFPDLRTLALRALADRPHTTIVHGLLERLRTEPDPLRRREYADALSRVYKKPGPHVYWGYRSAPRPAHSVAWELTATIEGALNRALADDDFALRVAVLERMLREKVPVESERLAAWLKQDHDPGHVEAILAAIDKQPPALVRSALGEVIVTRRYEERSRLSSFASFVRGLDASSEARLLEIAERLADGPVAVKALTELANRPSIQCTRFLLAKLDSPRPEIRAEAIRGLAARNCREASTAISSLLDDDDIRVRREATFAAGRLRMRDVADRLLETAAGEDKMLRQASLASLRKLEDARAVQLAVAAIDHPVTQLSALAYLRDFGGPEQLDEVVKVAESERSIEGLTAIVDALSQWKRRQRGGSEAWRTLNHAIATVHGGSGTLLHWSSVGPVSSDRAIATAKEITAGGAGDFGSLSSGGFEPQLARHERLGLAAAKEGADDATWLAVSDVFVPEKTSVQFLASTNGALEVWLNRGSVFRRNAAENRSQDQFDAVLPAGTSRLLVQVSGAAEEPQLQFRFRRVSSRVEHEHLMKLALESEGNAERGGKIFGAAEKSQCVKCHRIGDVGGTIGPDLSGVGSRFSRIHLIESILEPSRTIAPSYHSITVLLVDGRTLTGVKLKESDDAIVLGDTQGKTHSISRKEIRETFAHPQSAMPEGLEKALSEREFVDLVAFLLSQT